MSSKFQFKEVVGTAQQGFRSEPESAKATFSATSEQIEGLQSKTTVRQFTLQVDEPEALAGTDTGPNPVEYALAALASCQEITYRLYADSLGIPLEKVSVEIEGDVDLRGFFAVDPNVRPGYEQIRGRVRLEGPATDAEYQRLKDIVDQHCPVLDLFRNPTPVTLDLATESEVQAAE